LFIAGDQVPVNPLLEVVGKLKLSPEQIGPTGVNIGAEGAFTLTNIVVVVAHCPGEGVNVYVVEVLLLMAGTHVPVIPLFDVVGNVKVPPTHIPEIWVNTGITGWLTVTVIIAVVAHTPAEGVKVYVVVLLVLITGDHAPVIALLDVVGKEKFPPTHIGATWVKEGVIGWFTVTVMVVVFAHWPEAGVNVYVVVVKLLIAGLHVPLIPLFEVDGKVKLVPLQIVPICVNKGVTGAITVTVFDLELSPHVLFDAFKVTVYVPTDAYIWHGGVCRVEWGLPSPKSQS
jgi:hypothetical protein